MKRLPPIAGEWIDRNKPLNFRFEGREYQGYSGDTITSALAAAGEQLFGRSFKYHRPRSVLSFANHDANVIMQAGEQLNLRADVTPLTAGLDAVAVNTMGGLRRDRMSFMNHMSPFLPVGFYYKAFHTKRLFPFWDRMFRRMTGLGTVVASTPRLHTPKRYDFCQVLVIGGGIAGMNAALAAAEAGAKVVLVDENQRLGGSALFARGNTAVDETLALIDTVETHPRIQVYTSTYAAGYYADRLVPLVEVDRITKMRADAVICAAGAFEQPAVFRYNDLPGVMLASAAQRLIYRYAVAPGKRAVVLTANADGYRAALDLHAQGIGVAEIVDLRGDPSADQETAALSRALYAAGISTRPGYGVLEGIKRHGVLSAALVAPISAGGELDATRSRAVECDLLVMSVGWAPALNLLYQANMRVRFDERLQQYVPDSLPDGVYACGRANGVYAADLKTFDGQRAGLAAATSIGFPVDAQHLESLCAQAIDARSQPSHPYPIFAHRKHKNFIDFDEDLQLKDLFNAAQEGFDNIELIKRYSTIGMGPSQGKHSNMNAIRVLARIRGLPIQQVGSTTARPMFHPVPISHLAGRAFHLERETPLHSRHAKHGAVFMAAGEWQRPAYYARAGEDRDGSIQAEAAAVRSGVGLIDVGTLGKIEVRGADAVEFLERVYTGNFAKLRVGATRYGLMLDESGVIIDDGVVARFADTHFYCSTTSSGSSPVYREMMRLNTIWKLRVGIVNLTGHFGAINLAGPQSRTLLAALTDIDLSEAVFPYLGVRCGHIAGVEARLLRVGFVGELGYEIHAPADNIAAVWDALTERGATFGIRPFGVEAQRLLRLEKGHLIVSQDTDGLTTPLQANMKWALAMNKPFFVGQRSLQVQSVTVVKQQLTGFTLVGDAAVKESHLVIADKKIVGRVTSVSRSTTVNATIGLAYLPPEHSEPGTPFQICIDDGQLVEARVAPVPFYDKDNSRQKLPEAT